jgi:hypothetical protein
MASAHAAKTRVTIRGTEGDFHGKIFSARHKCLGGRKVTVFRLSGNGFDPQNDQKIASDTSERHRDHGVWSVGNTGFKHGKFYAKVARKPGCKPDFSNVLQE